VNLCVGRRELLLLVERPSGLVERGLLRGDLRGIGVALRTRLVEFLGGNDGGRGITQFQTALESGFGQCQAGLGLHDIFFGFGERGGFGLPFQFKQELASFYLIAAHDGEIGERAAKRGGDVNIFALDVALKGVGEFFQQPPSSAAASTNQTVFRKIFIRTPD